ncbi:hypothetical protein CH063_01520 [Colletotrichum higginsianum]|uniref:Uncharacterized protein n=2 Tax=Colletotrichum higginsianum TaxID=80884 RepID=H1V8K5_COLHI|nr:hypothetical protein CH63R_12118 [Colletotrichum higginsianum IMI 349063]OBR05415.1 hypothetical protein CH63R_12118 [Colletotrichum higginsianum IMI 349063]TIC93932.1 hypothetical protein CH35J_009781 [Colletotrichum higginsianum]CCF36558.1 hypothetical protein CH063_01520 [Colletotrichum higginsianum]
MKTTIILAAASGIVLGASGVTNDIARVGAIDINEPVLELTTVLDGPGAYVPTSAGGNGITVIQSTICRPVFAQTCEVMKFTSSIPVAEVVTSTVSSETKATSATEVISSSTKQVATSTSETIQSTESSGTIQIPSATASANKESDANGLWAGIALLMLL